MKLTQLQTSRLLDKCLDRCRDTEEDLYGEDIDIDIDGQSVQLQVDADYSPNTLINIWDDPALDDSDETFRFTRVYFVEEDGDEIEVELSK